MEKLKMQTINQADANFEKLAALFPNIVTESIDSNGNVVRAIDAQRLAQEINSVVLEGNDERYQFTWPDKRKAQLAANAPITATLRPCREESVDFDTTGNLYIEGDNLDVLKCLKETYSGKIKMIYIDPPYNTGNDFVYNDDFAESASEYLANSGQYDDQGNRLVTNTESNGRYHTDWLNMMYPRLKVARDLLTEDGVIFISIDGNELINLRKICDEIFGQVNFVNQFVWLNKPEGRQIQGAGAAGTHEYIIVYAKQINNISEFCLSAAWLQDRMPSSYKNNTANIKYDHKGAYITTHELHNGNSKFNEETRPTLVFDIYYRECDEDIIIEEVSEKHLHEGYYKIKPHPNADGTHKYHAYRWSKEKILKDREDLEFIKVNNMYKLYSKRRNFDIVTVRDIITDISTVNGNRDLSTLGIVGFDYPKSVDLLSLLIKMLTSNEETSENYEYNDNVSPLILDFFSGSATTAHAVMQLNAEDDCKRRYIMVQLKEQTDVKSKAYKEGYQNICEIAKERIRRAGKKIKEENPNATALDTGFRVLKLDSSNMQDVYYAPADVQQGDLFAQADNIKSDRTPEDLLFQVMLELGVLLDSKIETKKVAGKQVFNVADGFLVACFDSGVTDEVITAIAKQQPQYAVLRDSSYADDSTATNFEQLFKTYSPNTTIKTL